MNHFERITNFLYEEKTKELEKIGKDGSKEIIGFAIDKSGGALTFLRDRAEAQRGYPAGEFIQIACGVKKALRFSLEAFREKNLISKILMIVSGRIWAGIMTDLLYFFSQDYFLPFKKLSQPVKEIYRNLKEGKIRDLICLILEFDFAYRYRLQDIIIWLSKHNLAFNPLSEISRLFWLLEKREKDPAMVKRWRIIKTFSIWYLRFHPKTLKEIKKFFLSLNLKEFEFTKEDMYWTSQFYGDYLFRGKTRAQRTEEMRKIYGNEQIKKDEMYIIANNEI